MRFNYENANEQQKQAIKTVKGPVLIIAGPGTGKTSTLVKRIRYMITMKNIKPEEILVATFTEKAAKEIVTRVTNELIKIAPNVNLNDMYIGTFHSICLRLLGEYVEYSGLRPGYSALDEYEQQSFIFKHLSQFSSEIEDYNEMFVEIPGKEYNRGKWKQAELITQYLNKYREEIVDEALWEQMLESEDVQIRSIAQMVNLYNTLLEEANSLDFCKMQCDTYKMLTRHPETLEDITNKIKYIMVDEYQDTNYIQEQIVLKLKGEEDNVCVVGDDDQGIYRFRGATISNIFNFPKHFADGKCKQITLATNYRSQKEIIDFYNKWMDDAKDYVGGRFQWGNARFAQKIEPMDAHKNEQKAVVKCTGDKIESVDSLGNNCVEYKYEDKVCKLIKQLMRQGTITDYNQVAILRRSSYGAENLINTLEAGGIPVYAPRMQRVK